MSDEARSPQHPPLPPAPVADLAGAAGAAWLPWLLRVVDAHAIVAITDAAGTILYVNERFSAVSGYESGELIGRNHRILKSDRHSAAFYKGMWGTISAGRVWHGTICNRRKDGKLYWVESTIMPVSGEDGKPAYYLALRTDVTRLKQVEEQLAQLTRSLEERVVSRTAELSRSEDLYRVLLASVTDYHYTVEVRDGAAVSTRHTPTCEAVTGYTAGDFLSDPGLWLKMVHPDDRALVVRHAEAALKGSHPAPLEHRIVRKDGEQRWIRDTIVTRRDAAGNVAFYDGIINDITAERQARAEIVQLNAELEARVASRTSELRTAHDQLRLFFDHAPIGISWVEWGDGERPDVYHLNHRFREIIGLTREESVRFENIRAVTHPEDLAVQDELMRRVYRGEMNTFSLEKRYIHRDGRIVWGDLTVAVLRNSEGRATHQFAMLLDITARRAAEERVRRSEQRLRTYVECASEVLYALSPEGVFTFVSPAWKSKLGHDPEKIVGRSFAEFVHPEDIFLFSEYLAEVLAVGGASQGVEYRVRHQDGSWYWHSSTGARFMEADFTPSYFGVARDITERRAAEAELRLALARREELERIVDRSPSVVVLWRAEEGAWPVEFVSQSIRQFGYTPEEMMGRHRSFLEITHPEDRERVQAEVRAHAVAGHTEYNQEYRIRCADDTVRWVDDHTVVRRGDTGEVTHHEGIITDITSRKAAEDREREARERDLQTAAEVQQHLLPRVFPDLPEVEVDAYSAPSLFVGGDYYDVLRVDERHWGFVVADVSGKGTAAALMMAACRATLHAIAPGERSPAATLSRLNRALAADMPRGRFIAVFYAVLDLDTRELRFARAGHEPAIMLRGDSPVPDLLAGEGLALGLDQGDLFDEMLTDEKTILGPGDLLALYTDGITEAVNAAGEEFGRERLATLLLRHHDKPLSEVSKVADRYLRQFSAVTTRTDDRTLMLVRLR